MKAATIENTQVSDPSATGRRNWKKGKPALSMIEMGIGLMVVVTFIALALGGAQRVLGQSEVAEEATNISMLSTAVRATRTGLGYNSAANGIRDDLVATNGIPTNMAYNTSTGVLTNRWSGAVTFAATGTNNENFTITYAAVPLSECTQLLMTVKGGILRSVTVGGDSENLSELTTAIADGLCGTANPVSITWSSALAS